jgi:DAACS family dicarboxylate/amino acid:cation (Na+ or H+) symporter
VRPGGLQAVADNDRALAHRILVGLVAGVIAGIVTLLLGPLIPGLLPGARWLAVHVLDPFGQVFLRLLFFIIIPLIFASLTIGVLQLGDLRRFGPLAGRTFLFFFLNMSIAAALGLTMMNVVQPGAHLSTQARERLVSEFTGPAAPTVRAAQSPDITPSSIVDMFMPRNLAGAVTGSHRETIGEMLPLILFAILVGVAATRLEERRRAGVKETLQTVADLMTSIVRLALRLAPYAVPALMYSVIVKIGFDILKALGAFVAGCVVVLLIHLFGTMSLWLKAWTAWTPRRFFSEIRDALITAFSTSSSMATLPTAMLVARERLGVSQTTTSFVLPIGTTMNMSGTALYEGCVVLFIAQIFGVHLDFGQQVTLLLLAVLSAVAVSGIPGGALPLIAGLLVAFGLPPESIGIILGIEGLLGATRTMVNVGADIVTATVVDAQLERAGHVARES